MTPQQEHELQKLISHAVRDLPARRAPSTLEERVQAEIARRAALPWWKKSFVHWPMAFRVAFLVVGVAVAKLALSVSVWATAGLKLAEIKAAFAPEIRSLETISRFGKSLADSASAVIGVIPPLWLYGGLAVLVACYVTVFGIGAAAYRSLYRSR